VGAQPAKTKLPSLLLSAAAAHDGGCQIQFCSPFFCAVVSAVAAAPVPPQVFTSWLPEFMPKMLETPLL